MFKELTRSKWRLLVSRLLEVKSMTAKQATRYEQVPVAVAKKIALREGKLLISKPRPAVKKESTSAGRVA
jgi:hypothetical protein